MFKYVFNHNKRFSIWFIVVLLCWSIEVVVTQYIFKFIGFVIDYGLNYKGTPYQGALSFLFDGRFGEYGSKQLIITLSIAIVLFVLIAYSFSIISGIIKTKVGNSSANIYRWQIYNKTHGKKLNMSSGDYLVFLHEDIYKPGNLFISTYTSIVVYVIGIAYSIIMLGDISPYLIITPVAFMPLLIWYFLKYRKKSYQVNQKYREIDGKLRNSVANSVCSQDQNNLDNFESVNSNHSTERKSYSMFSNKYGTILSAIRITIYIISCIIAGFLAIYGKILIGEYLIFIAFVNTIFTKLIALLNSIVSINAAAPRVKIVQEFMAEVQ